MVHFIQDDCSKYPTYRWNITVKSLSIANNHRTRSIKAAASNNTWLKSIDFLYLLCPLISQRNCVGYHKCFLSKLASYGKTCKSLTPADPCVDYSIIFDSSKYCIDVLVTIYWFRKESYFNCRFSDLCIITNFFNNYLF